MLCSSLFFRIKQVEIVLCSTQVTHPLQDHESIAARLDAVTEIAESMGSMGVPQGDGTFPGSGNGGGYIGSLSRGGVGEGGTGKGLLVSLLLSLGKLPDVERGITRIFLRTATAAEVMSILVHSACLCTVPLPLIGLLTVEFAITFSLFSRQGTLIPWT